MQTEEGRAKATETIKQKYGQDYFSKLGAKGGAKSKGRTPWNKGKKVKKEQNARRTA